MTADAASRLKKKQEEEVVIRKELYAKQQRLRESLKEWDKLQRESDAHGLRSELSEKHVRLLAGESVGGAAF